jgi:D-sedoheptulose 7-phosphate isomerase
MKDTILRVIEESIETKRQLLSSDEFCEKIKAAAEMILETYRQGGKVLLCGNGGSASDAQHIEGELVGRFQMVRRGLPAIALTANSSNMTSIGNDFSFDHVFSRQVEAQGKEGDVFIGITTSGNSQSVLNAFLCAKSNGLKTIGLLGRDGGKCREVADISLIVPSDITARVQESHIMIGHIWCELTEDALFGNE